MTREQALIVNDLIRKAISDGFDNFYPLAPIAGKHGMKSGAHLWDGNTETGILKSLVVQGYLSVTDSGEYAAVSYDDHDLLTNWCRNALTGGVGQ